MAETSPLINLDLVNQIYKVINAQVAERVYNPRWDTSATLGSDSYKYVEAYISGNTSTGTLNNLTLAKATTGFTISGGDTSKTLTIADSLNVKAATNIMKGLTVGADTTYTGAVTIRSAGSSGTTITGPNSKEAILIDGTYTTSATTSNSDTPTAGSLLKIKTVDAKMFLAGPLSDLAAAAPTYRSIVASDLPVAGAADSGIVTTEAQTFAGAKTFSSTISGSIDGNAKTATTADKTAYSLSIKDGAASPGTAIDGWNGSDDKTLTIKGDSPVTVTATDSTIKVTHDTSGVTADTYRSVTVNAEGHVTAGTNPTTLSGYGITDAKIESGVVTLGSNTITPLTTESPLAATSLAAGSTPTVTLSSGTLTFGIPKGDTGDPGLPGPNFDLTEGSGIQYLIGAPRRDGNINTATTSGAHFNGSDLYATGFYVSSLRSLKENIEPTKVNAIELINAQEIVDFNYKADEDKVHKVGLIADDSDPLFLDKKGETVDLYNTCGILMKAVQELSKRVEELEQKLK